MNPKTVQYLSLDKKGTCCMRCIQCPCQKGPMLVLSKYGPAIYIAEANRKNDCTGVQFFAGHFMSSSISTLLLHH